MCPVCDGLGLCSTCRGSGTVMDGLDNECRSGYGGHWCPKCFDLTTRRGTGKCRACEGAGEIVD